MTNKIEKPPSTGLSVAMLVFFLAMTMGRLRVGAAITAIGSGAWYQALRKAPFNPPDWVFAPIWTVLYLAMAIAAWRVWRRVGIDGRRIALLMFGLQLSLNLYWSYLFFGSQMVGFALVELIVLLGVVIVTWWQFLAIDRLAGMLFVPYVAWVVFAGVLNAWIFALN